MNEMNRAECREEAIAAKSSRKRLLGFDVARSLAIFSMVVVHFNLTMSDASSGPAWLSWFVGLLPCRAAATFVTLAGIGVSLMSRRAREENSPDEKKKVQITLLKRAIFLFVAGLLYWFVWPADILHYYGIYLCLGSLLLFVDGKRLWVLAGAFLAMFPLLFIFFDYESGWNWSTLEHGDFWTPAGFIRNLLFNGWHPLFPWFAFFLAGMWLGRQDFNRPEFRFRVMAGGLTVAICAEALSYGLVCWIPSVATDMPHEIIVGLFGREPLPPMPLFMLQSGGLAFFVIGACMTIAERFPRAFWLEPMAHAGQMALSLYIGHVVIGMGILETIGKFENQTLEFSVCAAIVFSLVSIVACHAWRKRFSRGPVEWVMRRMTG